MDWTIKPVPRMGLVPILDLPDEPFVALVVADATKVSTNDISDALESLFDGGMGYLCAWGPDCERVHDIADEIIVGADPPADSRQEIMTTWHADESVEEAFEFAATIAGDMSGIAHGVAIVVGNDDFALPARRALWLARREYALRSALEMAESLVGETLDDVAYVGFPYEDPARSEPGTPPGAHFVEMAVDLRFRSGRTVGLTWTGTMGQRSAYELDILNGPSSVGQIDGPAVDWRNQSWKRASPEEGDFRAWSMSQHPFWSTVLAHRISAVRCRTYDEGIWDLQLELGDRQISFYCWDSDVIFVSDQDRPVDADDQIAEHRWAST